MARAFPVPVYTTAAVAGGTSQRKLSTASPGTTDSTATLVATTLLLGYTNWLIPEANSTGVGSNATGWAFDPLGPLVPTNKDGFVLGAGTFTVAYHYSRPGGLLTGDVTGIATISIYKADAGLTTFTKLGEAATQTLTYTTTEQSVSVNINAPQTTFLPGEKLWMAIVVTGTAPAVTDSLRIHTNSATATRITAAPPYTVNYSVTHAESVTLSETHSRRVAYSRAQSEAISVPAEQHQAPATYRRTQFETVPVPLDAHERVYMAVRGQSEAIPLTDLHARLVAYRRAQGEASSVTDIQSRQVTYVRVQAENLTSGGGQVVIAPVFNMFA